ncbi:negative elongation factor A, partial [Paramuricea clavata]
MECPYLNRGALLATIGAQPAPAKHFTLRRKPKSAALKAELFQKATESSSGLKRSHSMLAGSTNAGSLKRSDSTGKSPVKQNVPLARVHSKTAPTTGTSALRGLSAASLKQQNRTAK